MQITLDLGNELKLPKKLIVLKEIINDRKSKYSVVGAYIENLDEISDIISYIKSDKYFKNATHNSYAYRIKQENNSIIEGKNDDGETGAGMCILREIQRVNGVNMIIIVTRYFGGIKLQSDRFKNVIDACKIFFNKL